MATTKKTNRSGRSTQPKKQYDHSRQRPQPESEGLDSGDLLSRQPSGLLSRQPSEFLSRQPSPLLSRSHQTSTRQESTVQRETVQTETVQTGTGQTGTMQKPPTNTSLKFLSEMNTSSTQPVSQRLPTVPTASIQRMTDRSVDKPRHKTGHGALGTIFRKMSTNTPTPTSPTSSREGKGTVSIPTGKPRPKPSFETIQLAREPAMLHHPNNRQIFLRNFTQTDEGVRVRTNNWTKGPSHGIQHKFSNQDMANVDVDFEEQDRTGKYVKVFYDTNDAKDIEGYVNHRLVVTNPKPNPTIHQMPNALAQGLTTHYRGNTGALFPTPPTSDEAKQGLLGDCFLISAVATIVAQNATHITNMMIDHGNRVTVRFYENGKPVYIVVDKNTTEFVSTVGGGPAPYQTAGGTSLDSPYAQGPLWIQLLEKAYAIFKRQTYQELNNGGRSHYAFEEILNTNATRRELTARELNLRSIPKNQLPWLNYDPPKKQRELRGKQQGLFLDIFNSHPTKIQIWSTFVDQNTVGGETLDSIQEELRTAALPAGIIDDVMRYLARQDWYSGYSGSKLYGIKDMKVFEDITERLASGELVTAASQKFTDHTGTSIPTKREVHGGHMYSVFGTRDRGGILEIEIRNPWGSGGVQYQLGPPRDYSQELEMLEQPNPSGRYWIELSHFVDTYDLIDYTMSHDTY